MVATTPKLDSLPAHLLELLRNSFGCQRAGRDYSETRLITIGDCSEARLDVPACVSLGLASLLPSELFVHVEDVLLAVNAVFSVNIAQVGARGGRGDAQRLSNA